MPVAADTHGPPAKPVLERAVLGAAIRSTEAREQLFASLVERDFYYLDHQAVFAALNEAVERGDVNSLDLASSLENFGVADPYDLVNALVAEAALLPAMERHLDSIKAVAQSRTLTAEFTRLAKAAESAGADRNGVETVLSDADALVRKTSEDVLRAQWLTMGDLTTALNEEGYTAPVMPTGFVDVDAKLGGGLRPGQVCIIAARPSVGKSTLALDMCRHASITKDVPGLLVSLEMSGTEIAGRLMSAESGVPLQSIQNNEVTLDERTTLEQTTKRVIDAPLYFVDKVPGHWPAVKAIITSAVRRLDLKYVALDYIQLLDDGTTNTDREKVVSNISRQFKMLMASLGIAGVLLSQLNRGSENRGDKRPQMSDLRESGSLEQDADIVMLLFRPDMVDTLTDRPGEADLDVVKNRGGDRGSVTLAFQGAYSRFQSYASERRDPYRA